MDIIPDYHSINVVDIHSGCSHYEFTIDCFLIIIISDCYYGYHFCLSFWMSLWILFLTIIPLFCLILWMEETAWMIWMVETLGWLHRLSTGARHLSSTVSIQVFVCKRSFLCASLSRGGWSSDAAGQSQVWHGGDWS